MHSRTRVTKLGWALIALGVVALILTFTGSSVLQIIGFPYAAGPDFISAVVSHGGLAALNAAYKKPPVSVAPFTSSASRRIRMSAEL